MNTEGFLTDDEINALVQIEAGNDAYFQLTETQVEEIRSKIESSDINKLRYMKSQEAYAQISVVISEKTSSIAIWKLAAAVALILVASSIFMNYGVDDMGIDSITQSVPEISKEELLSANFQLNEELENYTNYPTRSAGYKIIKPATGVILTDQVAFEWIPEGGNDVKLKLYNNQKHTLLEQSVNGRALVLDQILDSGLYYWSLENEDEIVHWGKFYYKNEKK